MPIPPPSYPHLVVLSDAIAKSLAAILRGIPNPAIPLQQLIALRDEYDDALKNSHPDNPQSPEALLSPHAFARRLVNDALNQFVDAEVKRHKAEEAKKQQQEGEPVS